MILVPNNSLGFGAIFMLDNRDYSDLGFVGEAGKKQLVVWALRKMENGKG